MGAGAGRGFIAGSSVAWLSLVSSLGKRYYNINCLLVLLLLIPVSHRAKGYLNFE